MYAAAFSPCAETARMPRLLSSARPSRRMAGTKNTCETPWAWMSSANRRAPEPFLMVVVTGPLLRPLPVGTAAARDEAIFGYSAAEALGQSMDLHTPA